MNQPDRIEHLNLDDLIPYARNARTHSHEQVAQIAASIREFGFTNPVLIDDQGGIIAGHGRVLGARQLGLATVPCIRLGYLSDAQKRAYILADNKLALNAGWDESMLAQELEDLRLEDYDIDLTGFDAAALEALMDAGTAGGIDGGSTPKTSTREIDTGDFYLGHRCPRCGFEFNDDKA